MSSSPAAGLAPPDGAPAGSKSRVSAGTSDRAVKPLPPPPPIPSSRLPRNCTASATISTFWRLLPSLSSHSRHSRRPSIATGRPLARNRAQFSPCAPQTVTSKKLGLSSHSPDAPLRRVLQATRSEHTARPLPVERSSGSRVRLPVRTTLLMLVAAMEAPFDSSDCSKSSVEAESRGGSGCHDRGVACCGDLLAVILRPAAKALQMDRPRRPRSGGLFCELGRRTGGGHRGRAQIRRRRRAGPELDDPEAQDAVRDLEVVVQLLEQRGGAAELEQVVVGLGVLADLVDRMAVAPVVAT